MNEPKPTKGEVKQPMLISKKWEVLWANLFQCPYTIKPNLDGSFTAKNPYGKGFMSFIDVGMPIPKQEAWQMFLLFHETGHVMIGSFALLDKMMKAKDKELQFKYSKAMNIVDDIFIDTHNITEYPLFTAFGDEIAKVNLFYLNKSKQELEKTGKTWDDIPEASQAQVKAVKLLYFVFARYGESTSLWDDFPVFANDHSYDEYREMYYKIYHGIGSRYPYELKNEHFVSNYFAMVEELIAFLGIPEKDDTQCPMCEGKGTVPADKGREGEGAGQPNQKGKGKGKKGEGEGSGEGKGDGGKGNGDGDGEAESKEIGGKGNGGEHGRESDEEGEPGEGGGVGKPTDKMGGKGHGSSKEQGKSIDKPDAEGDGSGEGNGEEGKEAQEGQEGKEGGESKEGEPQKEIPCPMCSQHNHGKSGDGDGDEEGGKGDGNKGDGEFKLYIKEHKVYNEKEVGEMLNEIEPPTVAAIGRGVANMHVNIELLSSPLLPEFKRAFQDAKRGYDKKYTDSGTQVSMQRYLQNRLGGGTAPAFKSATVQSMNFSKWLFLVDVSGSVFGVVNGHNVLYYELDILKSVTSLLPPNITYETWSFQSDFRLVHKGQGNRVLETVYTKIEGGGGTSWSSELVSMLTEKAKDGYQIVILTDGAISVEPRHLYHLLNKLQRKPLIFIFSTDDNTNAASFGDGNVLAQHGYVIDKDYAIIRVSDKKPSPKFTEYIRSIVATYAGR